MHALLYERLGVQFLSHFDTELKMFAHEILKFLGSDLLPLFLIEDVVVVLNHFLNGLPELLDHARHVDCFLPYFYLLVLELLLFLQLFLLNLLLTSSGLLLRVSLLFLSFPLKILRHPFHLLNQEPPMTLG
jgi:hypothetical protein